MDSKGRPTKLEDIISAESLIDMMGKLSDMAKDHGGAKGFRDLPIHSTGISKAIHNLIHSDKNETSILLMSVMTMDDPSRLVCAWVQMVLVAIDEAIKQRAEVEELREMAAE